jgi:large subunit ribosomal protein L3
MCKGLLGIKKGMMGLYSSEGKYIPVTVIEVGPCVVTQIKTVSIDGYNALQLGFGDQKKARINKPIQGHLKKSGVDGFRSFGEVPSENPENYTVGQKIPVDIFKVGDRVDITGKMKGRGFSGVIKRHGFHGGKGSHGSHSHRIPGSIGSSAWPSRVAKGKRLPGQYGNVKKTVLNLEVVDIRPEANLILIKGAIPGCSSGMVTIKMSKHK